MKSDHGHGNEIGQKETERPFSGASILEDIFNYSDTLLNSLCLKNLQ
jgi:hypothetical protein